MKCPVCGVEFEEDVCTNCGFEKNSNKVFVEWLTKPYDGETDEQAKARIASQKTILNQAALSALKEQNIELKKQPETNESMSEQLEYATEMLESIKKMVTFLTIVTVISISLSILSLLCVWLSMNL